MSEQKAISGGVPGRNILVRWVVVLVLAGLFALWAGWRLTTAARGFSASAAYGAPAATPAPAEPTVEYWTCTMHPEVRASAPGDCPICGMTLVPKYAGSDELGVAPATPVASAAPPAHAGQTAGGAHAMHEEAPVQAAATESTTWYRCTMPECGDVGSADPDSRCPVCGMKREAVEMGGDSDADEWEITLNARARRLAELETEPATPRYLFKRLRTVGKVGYDETRYKMVSAWIDGRVDKLYADFTGMTVAEGDHLVEIYSPELLSAQEEYLQAVRSLGNLTGDGSSIAQRSAEQLRKSARRKLELVGVTPAQIEAVEQSGEARTHLVVHAPIGGTIVQKKVMEGMYVKTGDTLYTIADLAHLWLLIDLYEADLPWVQPFQQVRVTTQSLPGQVFTGEIVFIDPRVDARTRTVDVRVHVENPQRLLKPDMFVTAEIHAALGPDARAVSPAPPGAYVCPMHPWEGADEPGDCPICGMDLVPAAQLSGPAAVQSPAPLLAVPRGAVMQTGERAIVYVEPEPGTYRGAEVVVGPLATDADGREFYPILEGLEAGMPVVTRGNFVIDSQMQLAGKPSLFSARGVGPPHEHAAPDSTAASAAGDPSEATGPAAVQPLCPVMGNPIDPEVFVEYRGQRVYFCCRGCDDKFLAEPEKYMPKLPAALRTKLESAASQPAPPEPANTVCPVTGKPVDPTIWINYQGTPLAFAEPLALGRFITEPFDYLGKLPAELRQQLAAAEASAEKAEAPLSPWQQTLCPVMGNEINPKVYVDYKGVRVFFCCPGCDEKLINEPQKYLAKLPPKVRQVIESTAAAGGRP